MTELRYQRLEKSFDHYGIPQHLREGMAAYVVDGRQTGGFLRACFENNFVVAIGRAGGDLSLKHIRGVAKWIYNEAPSRCWGSPGVVKTWRGE